MSETPADEIARIVDETEEADDALRLVVERLVEEADIAWAGIAFLEEGTLTLGPSAGLPEDDRRTQVPIEFGGDRIGELLVDGTADPALLARVAETIAPQVLIGWDTGGEPWEP